MNHETPAARLSHRPKLSGDARHTSNKHPVPSFFPLTQLKVTAEHPTATLSVFTHVCVCLEGSMHVQGESVCVSKQWEEASACAHKSSLTTERSSTQRTRVGYSASGAPRGRPITWHHTDGVETPPVVFSLCLLHGHDGMERDMGLMCHFIGSLPLIVLVAM